MTLDKIETAVRAREIIKKAARNVAKEESPRKLIGRMMSVDLPRLRGTVWFPGDAQPVQVDIFANAVPAEWQHKQPSFEGQDSSTDGWGSTVVVERLNGILYVTHILTGGSAAIDFKTLGMSLMAQISAETSAGGPSADAIVDIAGRPHETFINCRIAEDDLDPKEGIEFGPFTSYNETTPFGGLIEISVLVGDSIQIYEAAVDIAEDFDIDNINYPQNVWARLIPKHSHHARWYPGEGIVKGSEYGLDICFRRTAYGNTENFSGYREMWLRIVKLNEWSIPGIVAYITIRSTSIQKGRSLGGRELFMQEKVHRPAFHYGFAGFHESGMGPTHHLSNLIDNFGRTVTGGWGRGDSVLHTDWGVETSAEAYSVDGESGCIDVAANNVHYAVINDYDITLNPDVTWVTSCPVVATGGNFRTAFILAQDPTASNNRMMIGLDFKPSGSLDICARQRVSGVITDMVAASSAGFTYTAGMRVKMRLRAIRNSNTSQSFWIKAWVDGNVEPTTWTKSFTFTPAAVWNIGYAGFYVFSEGTNTNTKPVRIKFSELFGTANQEEWAGHGEYWYTGPWRTGALRTAQDLQKTWTYVGNFSWNGTNLKLPTRIDFTGVGRQHEGLASGRAYLEINTLSANESYLHYPFRSTEGGSPILDFATADGIPLEEGESLWVGIEPGSNMYNFNRYLIVVDSRKAWQSSIPEWCVLIAQRALSDGVPSLRLGNGEVLDHWRAVSFATNWSNFGSGYDTAAYRMEEGGIVRLRGVVKHTTVGSGATITTLPAGFRPPLRKSFIAMGISTGSVGVTRIDVTTLGEVIPVAHISNGGSAFLSLEGITFNIAN